MSRPVSGHHMNNQPAGTATVFRDALVGHVGVTLGGHDG